VLLRSFNPGLLPHKGPPPGFTVAPGVRVARGPRPTHPVPVTQPPQPLSVPVLGLLTLGVIVALGVAGSGWAAALLPTGWMTRASLAAPFGVALLSIVGMIVDRAGVRISGGGGAAVAAGTTALGWGLWWWRRGFRGLESEAPDETPADQPAER